jgi:hypothetical protein
MNVRRNMNSGLKGGWHLITVKFFESFLFFKVKMNSLMYEVYGRIGRWIGIDPKFIKINGKQHPEGRKLVNINPEMRIVDNVNQITVVKIELCNQVIHNVETIINTDDSNQMKRFMIGGQSYNLYKFLNVKSFKRIIIFNCRSMAQFT